MKVGTNRLVGNQVSLHATKRIPSRFLRDDGKHKGTFGDEEVVDGEKRRDWDWRIEEEVRWEEEGEDRWHGTRDRGRSRVRREPSTWIYTGSCELLN